MTIGTIKFCPKCNGEVYVKAGKNCPICDYDFKTELPKKTPDIIVFLGTHELNRRAVVKLREKNMIDDF